MNEHKPVPVGGPLMTKPFKFLIGVVLLGGVMLVWRFAAGIGATSGLNDGYPWGIWIAFDVVTGTALACGGYAVAIMVYIFNKGKYHSLVRPAILTSALGYTVASVAIVTDVGRYWNVWKLPVSWGNYNLNSILLEVGLCVMAYIVVLWLELSPAFLEKMTEGSGGLANFARKMTPILDKSLVWIIALGMLLPTMHQSSLGGVMLLAGSKLHPLWHTPLLPLLFLMTCIAMGYGVVMLESTLSSTYFKRKFETTIVSSLSKTIAWLLTAYLVIRLADILIRGKLTYIFAFDQYSFWFFLETGLFIACIVMLLSPRSRNVDWMFRAAFMVVLAGAFYRFASYLIAYNPGEGWAYFPSVPEMLISLGIVALEIMIYIVIVKRFPIIAGVSTTAPASQEVS